MHRIIVSGYSGKMGVVLTNCINADSELEVACGVSKDSIAAPFNTYSTMSDIVSEDADVIIDFSHHSCIGDVLAYATKTQTPVVIATTGFNEEELNMIMEASKVIPVFHSYNMSLGVNVLLKLVKEAAKSLKGFDIEIIEKHHNLKVDSPSGTAVMIGNAVKDVLPDTEFIYGRHGRTDKRSNNEVGIHAIRGGTIVGEHTTIFAGHDEVIELTHTAQSKDVFAHGAIAAAKYMVNKKPGYYNMNSMFEEN